MNDYNYTLARIMSKEIMEVGRSESQLKHTPKIKYGNLKIAFWEQNVV